MRRFFKYPFWAIAFCLLLVLFLLSSLYLPIVQQYVKDKAISYVEKRTGLMVRVGSFSLDFPLRLNLSDVFVGKNHADTMFYVGQLGLDVGLEKLLWRELSVNELNGEQIRVHIENDSTGLNLRVALDSVYLIADKVDLQEHRVEMTSLRISDGGVFLMSGNNIKKDKTVVPNKFDWAFVAQQLAFHRIDYRMSTVTLPSLVVGAGSGVIVNGEVNIGKQMINADSVRVTHGYCRMVTSSESAAVKTAPTLWTVRIAAVQMTNGVFNLQDEEGKNFRIALEGINASVDSVYNRGTAVRGDLKTVSLYRPEGGRIVGMRGEVDLDTARVQLANVFIKTTSGEIHLNAFADGAINEIIKEAPVHVKMNADVSFGEIAEVFDKIPESLRSHRIKINTDFLVSAKRLDVDALDVNIPKCLMLVADARLTSLQKLESLDGDVNLKLNVTDASCLNTWLPANKYIIPRKLRLEGEVRAKSGVITPSLMLWQEKGFVSVVGSYSIPTKAYRGTVILDDFYPGQFIAVDSLGAISADITFNGRDFRFGKTKAELTAKLLKLEYKRHVYQHINVDASVERDSIDLRLISADPDADFELYLRGDSLHSQYVMQLDGRVKRLNLQALHFLENDFTVGLDLTTNVRKGGKHLLSGHTRIDNIVVNQGIDDRNIGEIELNMSTDHRHTGVEVVSGDFNLNFQMDTILSAASQVLKNVIKSARKQIDIDAMNAAEIQRLLPHFSLTVAGRDKNTFSHFLKSQNISFQQVDIRAGNVATTGLFLNIQAVLPTVGNLQLDSLLFGLQQEDHKLNYELEMMNPTGNLKNLYHIYAGGYLEKDRIQLKLRQLDKGKQVGVDIGMNARLQDSAVTISLFPLNPILARKHWNVNADNWITLHRNKKITADLQLSYDDKLVRIESMGDDGDKKEQLAVEIKGIDLKTVSDATLFLPDLGGILNTNILFYSQNGYILAEGMVGIDNFSYNSERIGNTELSLNYSVGNKFSSHMIDFVLQLDKQKRALAKGHFSTSEENRELDMDLDIPSLPLYMVNAFLPPGIMKLSGELTGKLNLSGTVDKPLMNGDIAFKQGQTEIIPLGTSFVIDSGAINIRKSEVEFANFGLIAPNRQRLDLNGKVFFSSLTNMHTDLRLKATNFQAVNVSQNSKSMVYGKAYVDLQAELKGALRALSLTGQVGLLNNTVIDYVVRNSAPELKDKSANLVRFVEFRDTTLNVHDDLTGHVKMNNFNMRLFIDIGNTVAMNINLSEDGGNQVAIRGGGNLAYVMDEGGRNSLLGKYTLSGGTVRYAIPVVGEKVFNIQTGSFVEWTGELMNPILNITAGELLKASVTEDNLNSRVVNFEAMILIKNNLQKPEISFDLSAPNDQSIQTQLAAFSADERAKQALNLMIYNTYSGPGTMSSSTGANNALNSFIESELNQWSRKYLKNAGLTLGIDSYNQYGTSGQEVKRTDFSYQFSKQFFNDKVNVKIGGRISTDNDPGSSNSLEQNLVDDIAIEYRFDKNQNLFMKVFRYTNYESVLDGEVTQTGLGLVLRKSYPKFSDIFRFGTEKSKPQTDKK